VVALLDIALKPFNARMPSRGPFGITKEPRPSAMYRLFRGLCSQIATSRAALLPPVEFPPEIDSHFSEVSRTESTELDHFFEPPMQAMIHDGVQVARGLRF
jgi:hypothetical protein